MDVEQYTNISGHLLKINVLYPWSWLSLSLRTVQADGYIVFILGSYWSHRRFISRCTICSSLEQSYSLTLVTVAAETALCGMKRSFKCLFFSLWEIVGNKESPWVTEMSGSGYTQAPVIVDVLPHHFLQYSNEPGLLNSVAHHLVKRPLFFWVVFNRWSQWG